MYDQLRRMLKLKWCIVCSNTIINNNFQCMKPTASDPNYLFTNIQRHTSFGLRQTWTGNNTLTIGNLFLTQLCREKCIFLMTKILINLMIGNLLAQKLFSVQNNLFFSTPSMYTISLFRRTNHRNVTSNDSYTKEALAMTHTHPIERSTQSKEAWTKTTKKIIKQKKW